MTTDYAARQKLVDPYNFVKAEDFFQKLDLIASGGEQASDVSDALFNEDEDIHFRQLILKFSNGRALSLRFIRPQVWGLRCNFSPEEPFASADVNTKNVVQPTIPDLIKVLDEYDGLKWDVELVKDDAFLVLQSSIYRDDGPSVVVTQLWIQRHPFQITAVQPLKITPQWNSMPRLLLPNDNARVRIPEEAGVRSSIVWQTQVRGVRYQGSATILSLQKPSTTRYLGWGEQAGTSLFKDNTFLNYFNYDNMTYSSVYNQGGPLDEREPLYHSEPFWVETNRHPGYQSKVATFVDNYSQICIDLGKTNKNELRIATRFDPADYYVIAAEDLSQIIQHYTAIVGRSWLKPRYALGYGQGAYGYDNRRKVEECVSSYRKAGFPLDTMHIDVDLQQDCRTFTVDSQQGKFHEPQKMFSNLREDGVKCCTNITPFINCKESSDYKTLNEMMQNNFFVADERDLEGAEHGYQNQRYLSYEGGDPVISDPNVDRPGFDDKYVFSEHFNRSTLEKPIPYHGGVNYGKTLGRSGYYPDLNRKVVRDWWEEQYATLIQLGLEFVWQDMTSPSIAKEYGDMKSFPCRLLLSNDTVPGRKQPAIQIWSLYAYNLHKATFKGWNRSAGRKGKRNFIIGRGSFAGMHRYAGLWTGDNAGTWGFLSISVSQSLALGLSGLVIAGGDVGGFMPKRTGEQYTDPELLIRWYSACFLLPWFRNHYNGKPKQKLFQEPYKYEEYYRDHAEDIGKDQKPIFDAVLPVSCYFTQLRYGLMQMLYDALFENVITGLPIVKSLILTEPRDGSLYRENENFLSSEYVVRNDLLVAPIMTEQDSNRGWRSVYLPRPDSWFKFNLSCTGTLDEDLVRHPLDARLRGGSEIKVRARIPDDPSDMSEMSRVTPMFLREGAIIPIIRPRSHVPDRTGKGYNGPANPITLHIYPGKDNSYDLYLDDGVSRASAPKSSFLSSSNITEKNGEKALVADPEAASCYRWVRITHETRQSEQDKGRMVRRVTIKTEFDGYGRENVERDIGGSYQVVLWQENEPVNIEVSITGTRDGHMSRDMDAKAVIVTVPVEADDVKMGITIEQTDV